jgi:hypothetical protein
MTTISEILSRWRKVGVITNTPIPLPVIPTPEWEYPQMAVEVEVYMNVSDGEPEVVVIPEVTGFSPGEPWTQFNQLDGKTSFVRTEMVWAVVARDAVPAS